MSMPILNLAAVVYFRHVAAPPHRLLHWHRHAADLAHVSCRLAMARTAQHGSSTTLTRQSCAAHAAVGSAGLVAGHDSSTAGAVEIQKRFRAADDSGAACGLRWRGHSG